VKTMRYTSPSEKKDALGPRTKGSVLQSGQSPLPHEPHIESIQSIHTSSTSAQSWSHSLLQMDSTLLQLLLCSLPMRLFLSALHERSAPHAPEVPNVRPNMIKRGTLVLQRVTMQLVLLLLCTLPQTVMGWCNSNEARTAPGGYWSGCPQGYDCADTGVSGICEPCVAGKWNGQTTTLVVTSCTSCVAGKYSVATGYSAGPTAAVCEDCTAGKYS
jgi:hypothetical protein